MSSNRKASARGATHRTSAKTQSQEQLEARRAEMYAAEGHAGSVPRGNQRTDREIMGSHRIEWDRVLGH